MEFLEIVDELTWDEIENIHEVLVVEMGTPIKVYRCALTEIIEVSHRELALAMSDHDTATRHPVTPSWKNDIDTHVAEPAIHFTKMSISHFDLQDTGNNTHDEIDTHIDNDALHIAALSWIGVTYNSSWGDYGTPYHGVSYCKDSQGMIHLRGFAKPNGSTATTIFTLPSGFRPASTVGIPGRCAGSGILTIQSDGKVVTSVTTPGWVSFDTTTFGV